jgi:hypothetical protein
MIWEVASLLAVGTLCAVTGWAAVYLAAKFQNRRPEMNPAGYGRQLSLSHPSGHGAQGPINQGSESIVELSHKRQTKCNLRQS